MTGTPDRVGIATRVRRALSWRAHRMARNQVWLHAHRLRRLRSPSPARDRRVVMHVTTSFDLGGTQRQIEYLARSPAARLEHRVTEIFPELNYLFRQHVTVDAARYTRGAAFGGTLGRAVANRNRRGWQLVQVWKLLCDFEAERPQAVVGWGHEICVTTFVAAALARVPHIVFCIRTVSPAHGWADPDFSSLLRRAHRRMTPLVDQVIANSSFLQADHAAWLAIDRSRIAVCPNGVEATALSPADAAAARARVRGQLEISDAAVVVTNIGRFSAEKGQHSLIEANRQLLAHSARPIVWLLAGDGATLADVKAAAEAQRMSNVVFTGRTNAVRDVLAASDVFVMPSDFEGMPNAMMEAMAEGLPCVSTTRSGARDVARDGIEALYYEPGDIARLVEHLRGLIDNPARARALGAAAQQRIREFDVARFVQRFEAVLDASTAAERAQPVEEARTS